MVAEQEPAEDGVVLRLHGISKRFPGVIALADVSLACRAGEVHALAGENGAGKSTLIKVVSGAHTPDSGEIELFGRRHGELTASQAKRLGVSVIYQEFNLFPELSVAENIFFGKEPTDRLGTIDRPAMARQAERLLQTLGTSLDVEQPVRELSVAQQQLVEIAKAIAEDARILIMDEPSAVLAGHELEGLFRLIRTLTAAGRSVIYISHRLDEVFEIADRVTVLKDGRSVGSWRIEEVSRAELIRAMVGRDLGQYPPRTAPLGEVALRVENLSIGGFVRDVSFELRRGEILGVGGLVGSGRSSLAAALAGHLAHGGRAEVAVGQGDEDGGRIALVPEDRARDGLFAGKSVAFNVSLPSVPAISRFGIVRGRLERSLVADWIRRLGVRPPDQRRSVETLSGGNQQKVVLARWLATNPTVLIVDEPTRGIDVGAKAEIYELLRELSGRGVAIVMVSSELPELLGMSDRILVLHEGAMVGLVDARDASEELIMTMATGQRQAA